MDLEYTWERYGSDRKGGRLSFSLLITCTRRFFSEKVKFRLVDGSGQLPPVNDSIELVAGTSFRINYDTYDWDWCDGDYIIIFDKKGREYDRKIFRMKTYAPGECPECHGSHHCATCHGTGRITDRMHMVSTCPQCLGTGLCQTCYVPTRTMPGASFGSTIATNMNPNVEMSQHQRAADLRKRIMELEQMISQCDFDERMRKMRTANFGYDTSRTTDDMRQAQLKYTYQSQLIQLRHELEQLERMGY